MSQSNSPAIVRTKEDFVKLCGQTGIPDDIFNTFDGMDFVIFLNEFRRITQSAVLTSVKSYSFKFYAPRCYNNYIGYFVDIHNAKLKINRNWLNQGMDEEWWKERITKIMIQVADWVKRIFYMNEYEEKAERLASMRKELDKKGIAYIDDEEYQAEYRRKLKYED